MRLKLWRTKRARSRELGAAAIEFALLLPFIAVILLGLVDYGYYFYIGINATEAARTAAVQASATAGAMNGGAGPTGCGDLAISLVTGAAPAAPAQAAKTYMINQVNATIGNNTTATVACGTAGSGLSAKTVFSVRVQVLFAPPSGTLHFGLPRSGSNLVYTTKTLWRWYP